MPFLPTEAGVVNLALLYVGERQTIDSLAEDTQPARVATKLFPYARQELLEAHDWSFARRRAALALVADEPERAEWAYAYALPSDCVAPRRLVTGLQADSADTRVPYELELGVRGRVLLTDLAEAELLYTAQATNIALWSASFCEALAWTLAPQLALALALQVDVARVLYPRAELAVARAVARDRNQAQEAQSPEASSIRARG